ncbi:MAG: hypothetical protein ACPGSW_10260 [Phaeobacter italicus]|jgi:hypothetical protein|uniref:Uncharacterized protein n=2 Tax=Phaeobacter italicus TaxID=481446 RepID=A0A0H5CWZ8_9RHOB|nr:hypothetical protein [Phaeobacter italicus]MBY6044559.1 hypothetical protein [Phaeobacter italicus]MCA0855657.1 hypothetical protein [Phaeobacter italicus]NKX40878.1 hypothetical protein [Rhodobacteraceae bacterium R_SAG2]CRL09264.1 hypothetical protein NIT7321_00093 [Phaeobacter italicus]
MTASLPEYYFRVRDNGAFVFRVESENRQRRLEMDQIAVVKLRNGEIKPHGDRSLSDADLSAIRAWMADRQALLATREIDDIRRTIDHLNHTAQWAQSRADDDQLDAISDDLLLAMHDLRSVLIRKKADRLQRAAKSEAKQDSKQDSKPEKG